MEINTATATQMKNNFGKYLNDIINGNEVIITKNGKEIGRMIPKDAAISYLSDSLVGVIKNSEDIDKIIDDRMKEKYGPFN